MKYMPYIAAILITVLISSCTTSKKENKVHGAIAREQAVEIAKAEAARMGYDIGPMSMETFRNAMPWYVHHPNLKAYFDTSEYYKGVKEKLKKRDYWAIYFSPKITNTEQAIHSGDLCVFVDSATGEVITDYVGPAAHQMR